MVFVTIVKKLKQHVLMVQSWKAQLRCGFHQDGLSGTGDIHGRGHIVMTEKHCKCFRVACTVLSPNWPFLE